MSDTNGSTAAGRPNGGRDALLIETIPHIVWVADAQGLGTYLNQAGAERLGIQPEAIDGWSWLQLVHPDDHDGALRNWEAAVAGGTSYSNEYRLRHADGSYRWYLSRAVPVRDAEGLVAKWVGTWTDVTDRKHAEQALRDSEERFRQIADSIKEVFWLTTPDKREIAYVSPGYEAIWGRSRDSLYASPGSWVEAIHPEDRERVIATALSDQTTGKYDVQYRVVRPDGAIRWIRDRAFPVEDESGRVVRVAGVAEDITKHRQLEAQLRQAQKMEAVGQLAGGVAHDFNNLLTIITGYSDLLAGVMPDAASAELLAEIKKAGERAAALTRQLLAFSRRQVLAPREMDVNAVIRDTEKLLHRVIGDDVALTTVLQPVALRVTADAGQVEQVLLSLAVNARDAMPHGGTLTIRSRRVDIEVPDAASHAEVPPGSYVMLAITDSGSGMSDEVRRRIFEPFFTTKGPGNGTGLGLAVVQGFVEQSGGHIVVDSTVGAGSSFRIYLPRLADPAVSDLTPSDTAPPLGQGSGSVLLVEDEASVRGLGKRILERCGYTVIEAATGEEALRAAREHTAPIDALVTDVVMPGIGGRLLAEQLRALHPETKVLYTSGYTDDAVVRQGILDDRVNFLQKPFTAKELAGKMLEILGRK